ncbi:MAG TPA: YhjD/YihY/BrkB family envelope integrity protein [Solirubrobacterales bacterium]|jgi:YihY family inner membrane protein|nr:YhjD/YihY/BrkB family envelope integrity protein [Solirubrobacterales bacterium]
MDAKAPLRRFDRYQQRHRALAAAVGVFKKFGDDEGGSMVSLIAYRAFFSLFPLLLLMTTILGYLLADDPSLRERVVESTLSQFPVIGDQLKGGSLSGSGVALAVGVVGSLLAGLGVVLETERSFDRVWGVPDDEQHGFLGSRLRAVGLLLILGGLAIASTIVSGLVAGGSDLFGPVWGLLIATALNLVVFAAVFRLLTASVVASRALVPGIVVATVGWELLQLVGGWYVSHEVRNATPVYGTFALVIGLLAWIHLGAFFTVLGAEANVVRERRLWPRSLLAAEEG